MTTPYTPRELPHGWLVERGDERLCVCRHLAEATAVCELLNRLEGRCDVLAREMLSANERLAASESAAAAMRAALSLLPDARWGAKTGRADYHASVGGDVLWKCHQALQSDAGKGWVSPERLAAVERERDEANWLLDCLEKIRLNILRRGKEQHARIAELESQLAAARGEVGT